MLGYAVRLLLRGKWCAISVLWLITFLLGAAISITSAMYIGQHEIESVFDFDQLSDVGLVQMSMDLSPISDEGEVLPQWREAWRRIEALEGLDCVWMQYRFHDSNLGNLLLNSAEMLNRVPLPLSQGTWPVWACDGEGNVPIILDGRLRGQYQVGDEMALSIEPYEGGRRIAQTVIVYGFLREEGAHVDFTQGRSTLFELGTYVSANAEDMVAITVIPDEIMAYVVERGGCALLVPKAENKEKDRTIRSWNETLSAHGIGDVLSMERLNAFHEQQKRQWMPTFIAVAMNMVLLLLIAMIAFVDMLLYRNRRCMGVLKMIGLDRAQWLKTTAMLCAVLIWPVCIGSILSRHVVLVYQTQSWAPIILPICIVLCALVFTEGFLLRAWNQIEPSQMLKEAQ